MFDKANEALKNWKSLLPMLRPLIKNETKNAVRRKKMNVSTAPNGTTIGVTDPADTTVINIPYQPACANVSIGQSVWVEWLYDNFSTAIAVTPGDGLIPSPLPVSQGGTGASSYTGMQSAVFGILGANSGVVSDLNIAPYGVSRWNTASTNKPPNGNYGVLLTYGTNADSNNSWTIQLAVSTDNPPYAYVRERTVYNSTTTWTGWSKLSA